MHVAPFFVIAGIRNLSRSNCIRGDCTHSHWLVTLPLFYHPLVFLQLKRYSHFRRGSLAKRWRND
jgi:hypothetical protein